MVRSVDDALFRYAVGVRHGAYLPHWTLPGATYHVVFRLADSLPAAVVGAWERERAALLVQMRGGGCGPDRFLAERWQALFSERVERFLDAGSGTCWLRRPEVAEIVAEALRHFDGARYTLDAWCVMPNHVHAIVRPMEGWTLPALLKSWKGYTARLGNRALGRAGAFWQPESYDHLLRDGTELCAAVRYVLNNPEAAGLLRWPWRGCSERLRMAIEHA